jgi:hypothetical protein
VSSIQITHWNLPSFTRLSTLGAICSAGTSVALDRSIVSTRSWPSRWVASSSSNGFDPSSKREPSFRLDLLGRPEGDKGDDRLLRTVESLPPARLCLLVVGGILTTGIDKSMPKAGAPKSGSSLAKSTAPPLLGPRLRVEDCGISWPAAASLDKPDGDVALGGAGLLSGGIDGDEKFCVAKASR